MIKLKKHNPPTFLTPDKIQELTNLFIESQKSGNEKSVWRDENEEIKKALLSESNHKCAYCECSVERAGANVEVEHFYPKNKDAHPDKVIQWDNLLPSCKRCNTKKSSNTNKKQKDIIHPYFDEPSEHLKYKKLRYVFKTDLGQTTIDKLDLNNQDRLIRARFEVSDALESKLIEISQLNASKLRNAISNILELCQPSTEFSAVTATIVHNDEDYIRSIEKLKNDDYWDDELEQLHNTSLKIVLN